MAQGNKPTKTELARLGALPRHATLVLEGGIRELGDPDTHGHAPRMAMWVDAESGLIRATVMVDPHTTTDQGRSEALEALLDVFSGTGNATPFGQVKPTAEDDAPAKLRVLPQPGLPARVVLDDARLATLLRPILDQLKVGVVLAEELPAFEAAYGSLAEYVDDQLGDEGPFAWEIDRALLPGLYKAAAGFARQAPWKYMPDEPPLAIALGPNGLGEGRDTLYASILGGGGSVMGVALYLSLEAYNEALKRGEELAQTADELELDDDEYKTLVETLRRAGAPGDMLPEEQLRAMISNMMQPESSSEEMEDCLAMFYQQEDEVDETYLAWLEEREITSETPEGTPVFLRTEPGQDPRPPSEQEVRALTISLEALNEFFKKHQAVLSEPYWPEDPLTHTALVGRGAAKQAIEVSFPPPGYEWDEEEEDDEVVE